MVTSNASERPKLDSEAHSTWVHLGHVRALPFTLMHAQTPAATAMGPIQVQWRFTSKGAEVPAPVAPPPSGTFSVPLDPGNASLEGLAIALEETQERMNHIATCWKDAVGPEQDSNMGRSNQASKDGPTADNDEEMGEEEDEGDSE